MALILVIFISTFLQTIIGYDGYLAVDQRVECDSNETCHIVCDHRRYKCTNLHIICPLNYECDITCSYDSCHQTVIHANESSLFTLYLHQNSYSEITIYLPSASHDSNVAKTQIQALLDTETNNNIRLTLYAIHGFKDIAVHPSIHSSNIFGTIFYHNNYSAPHKFVSLMSSTRRAVTARTLLQSETVMESYVTNVSDKYWNCNKSCNTFRGYNDHQIQINVEYTFSNEVIYNLKNMECVLFKIFEAFDVSMQFDICEINITNIYGGSYQNDSLFCESQPCLYSNHTAQNNGNVTIAIITDDTNTYNSFRSLSLHWMEQELEVQLMDLFDIDLVVNMQLIKSEHILWLLFSSIDKLWYIVALLVFIFCCLCCLLIWYMRHSRKARKKLSDLDKEERRKSLTKIKMPKSQNLKSNVLMVPSKSRECVTPSVTVNTDAITANDALEMMKKAKKDYTMYTSVRMEESDHDTNHTMNTEPAEDDPTIKPSQTERDLLMQQSINVPQRASSWHQTHDVHWKTQPQMFSTQRSQPVLAVSSNPYLNHFNFDPKQNTHNTVTEDRSSSESESLNTIQPSKCDTPSTDENSQHFPSDDDDDDDNVVSPKVNKPDCMSIDPDMILSDLASESYDRLQIHQPRQTTEEFHHNLTADIMGATDMMEDIVKDIASKD